MSSLRYCREWVIFLLAFPSSQLSIAPVAIDKDASIVFSGLACLFWVCLYWWPISTFTGNTQHKEFQPSHLHCKATKERISWAKSWATGCLVFPYLLFLLYNTFYSFVWQTGAWEARFEGKLLGMWWGNVRVGQEGVKQSPFTCFLSSTKNLHHSSIFYSQEETIYAENFHNTIVLKRFMVAPPFGPSHHFWASPHFLQLTRATTVQKCLPTLWRFLVAWGYKVDMHHSRASKLCSESYVPPFCCLLVYHGQIKVRHD